MDEILADAIFLGLFCRFCIFISYKSYFNKLQQCTISECLT